MIEHLVRPTKLHMFQHVQSASGRLAKEDAIATTNIQHGLGHIGYLLIGWCTLNYTNTPALCVHSSLDFLHIHSSG